MHAFVECQIGIFMISAFYNLPRQRFQAPEKPSRLIGSRNSVDEGTDIHSVATEFLLRTFRHSQPHRRNVCFTGNGMAGLNDRFCNGFRMPALY
jgi:hypothetical protein